MPQWTEYIPHDKKFDFQTYVRLLAISEVAWTDVKNKTSGGPAVVDYHINLIVSRLQHLLNLRLGKLCRELG